MTRTTCDVGACLQRHRRGDGAAVVARLDAFARRRVLGGARVEANDAARMKPFGAVPLRELLVFLHRTTKHEFTTDDGAFRASRVTKTHVCRAIIHHFVGARIGHELQLARDAARRRVDDAATASEIHGVIASSSPTVAPRLTLAPIHGFIPSR